jgi:tol-pal system protein YbgF
VITFPSLNSSVLRKTLLAASFLCLLPSVASAGLFDDDEARKAILDLRTKLEALSNRLDNKIDTQLEPKADKTVVLDLVNQNEQLRQDIAKLRGQIEVLTNDLSNTQRRQQDFYVDLDNRLRQLEPKKVLLDGKEATVDTNEQRAYDAALNLFKGGDYKNAATSLTSFITNYPQSPYQALAGYWLGNSYFAQRDCKNAVSVLQNMAKNFPDNPKAPDALLTVSACQLELKEKSAAKKTLETVIKQYPDTEAAQAAKARMSSVK